MRGLILRVALVSAPLILAGCVVVDPQVAAGMHSSQICTVLGPGYVGLPSEYAALYAELEKRGHQCYEGLVVEAPPRRDGGSTAPRGQAAQEATGTAFRIGPRALATAAHVIADAKKIEVRCPGASPQIATPAYQSQATDLAILTVSDAASKWLPVASAQGVALGDPLFVIGYPVSSLLGEAPRYNNGTISALSGFGGDASFFQISAPIQPGNSGGPVILPGKGVVGVVSSTAAFPAFAKATGNLPQNINFAVKADLLANLDRSLPVASAEVNITDAVNSTCFVVATT